MFHVHGQATDHPLPPIVPTDHHVGCLKAQFGNPDALAEWQPGTDHCKWPHAYCNQYRRVDAFFMVNVNITSMLPLAIDQLRGINI